MSLKNKSVLITGGAGFIGSHLADQIIREGPDTLVVVDDFFMGRMENLHEAQEKFGDLKVYAQDAGDYDAMKEITETNNVDVVFDLATIPLPASLERPRWAYETNVERCLTLCELIRNGCFDVLIHFSSSEAYGSLKYSPMDEKHPWNPTTPYAASKAAEDHLVFSYYHTFGVEMAIVRPFNNYGPRQNMDKYAGVVPLTIKRILQGEPPIIYGDGMQTRDYLYVTDTVDASVEVYNHSNTRGKVLNIASGQERTIKDVVTAIAQCLKWEGPFVYLEERPGDVRRHFADISLARELIGFSPRITFEAGIHSTVEWYENVLKGGRR